MEKYHNESYDLPDIPGGNDYLELDFPPINQISFEEYEAYCKLCAEEEGGIYNPTYEDWFYLEELPFGAGIVKVPKEEYEVTKSKREQWQQTLQQQREEMNNHYQSLEKIGYSPELIENNRGFFYEKRLLEVLNQSDIRHLNQIPQYVAEQKSLAQQSESLSRKKTPDYYEQSLLDLFENYEQRVDHEFLSDEELGVLINFFVKGYITDIVLFQRFEQLKQRNTKAYFRRVFHYGRSKSKGVTFRTTNSEDQENLYLTDDEASEILYFLEYKKGSYEDLVTDKTTLIQKFKTSYKQELKQGWIMRDHSYLGGKNSGFYLPRLEKLFQLTQDDITQWQQEAKQEFLHEYPISIQNLKEKGLSFDDTELGAFKSNQVNIREIAKNRKNLQDRASMDSAYNLSEHQEKISENVYTLLVQEITKLQTKQKIIPKLGKDIAPREKMKMSYKYQGKVLIKHIDVLYETLEKIAPEKIIGSDRKEKKEQYIQEYEAYFKNDFIEKRIASVLTVDCNNPETIKQKAITDVKEKFFLNCKKHIESKKQKVGMPPQYNPLSKSKTQQILQAAFLQTGWAVTLKRKIVPNDNERVAYRQYIIQTMIEEIIEEIHPHLLQKETFALEEYLLVHPLSLWYKRYGGQKTLLESEDVLTIQEHYLSFLEQSFLQQSKQCKKLFQKLLQQSTDRSQIKHLYENIAYATAKIAGYTEAFFKESPVYKNVQKKREIHHTIKEYQEENTKYMQEHHNIYPQEYIDKISFLSYYVQDIEQHIPTSIQRISIDLCEYIDQIKPDIVKCLLSQWFLENGKTGGKMQRIIEDMLKKEFGCIDLEKLQQRTYLLQYINTHLASILIEDAKEIVGEALFWNDYDLIKIILADSLKHRNIQQQMIGNTKEL